VPEKGHELEAKALEFKANRKVPSQSFRTTSRWMTEPPEAEIAALETRGHLRGALKDTFTELGGGEVYLHADRDAFRSDRYHKRARV
jgi:hypothetical protein